MVDWTERAGKREREREREKNMTVRPSVRSAAPRIGRDGTGDDRVDAVGLVRVRTTGPRACAAPRRRRIATAPGHVDPAHRRRHPTRRRLRTACVSPPPPPPTKDTQQKRKKSPASCKQIKGDPTRATTTKRERETERKRKKKNHCRGDDEKKKREKWEKREKRKKEGRDGARPRVTPPSPRLPLWTSAPSARKRARAPCLLLRHPEAVARARCRLRRRCA